MAAALHSVPPLPGNSHDRAVRQRQERANERLNDAAGEPIATVRALADNLTSAMGLLTPDQQQEVLTRIAPRLIEATSTAYRYAGEPKRRRRK